ncbi:MAG: TonB-dependent receptor [Bacteroidota bacterium]
MKRPITIFLSFFIALAAIQSACAQTQTVKGVILDAQAEYELIGATIQLVGSDPIQGDIANVNGEFRIEDVPTGRQSFTVTYIGYKTITLPNVLVTSGKEVFLRILLEESVEKLQEVVITADADKDLPINDLAKVSARTFSIEEVNRYSGGRNDVARLASSFAGVSTPDDSRNDIVVRGNSPTALLWRINGIPVSNVNHFSTLGTTGGPVSALNTNMLRTSDFITGAFPAEYGNTNGAVFDINFRDGNKDEYEFTGQLAAFSGLEFMAEGPISKSKNSSFLVSYRYGIAAAAAPGTSGIPRYQDLAFKLDLGNTALGGIELFGMGGNSSINFLGAEIDENDLFANPNQDAYVDSRLGLLGLNQILRLGKKTYIKNTLGYFTNQNEFLQDNFLRNQEMEITATYRATEVESIEDRINASTQFNTKFNARASLRTGVLVEFFNLKSDIRDRNNRPEGQTPDDNNDGIPDEFFQVRDADDGLSLWQPYAQGEYKFTDDLSVTGGLHGQYLNINENFVLEPRFAASWQFKPNQRLNIAYGLHSQMVPFPILFLNEQVGELGEFEKTNLDLTFLRSHHFVLGYDRKLGQDWRIKAETYYQSLFDIPIENDPGSSYSVLNEGGDFVFDERSSLVNEGTGFNYGIELTLEKFFSNNYYGLITTSLFESRYEGGDGIERSTAFNNNYVINALMGREWKVTDNDRRDVALTFDTRFSTSGGRPYTPIDVQASRQNNNSQVEIETLAFSERLDPYLRLDVKFGFRINSKRKKVSHQFFLDLQNVTNRSNQFTRRYNEVTQEENVVEQIGFFPDVLYRIQF